MSQGSLPAPKMGPRQSETPSWDRRWNYFQRLRFLQHGLSEQSVSRGGEERIAHRGWRKICYCQGTEDLSNQTIHFSPTNKTEKGIGCMTTTTMTKLT